MAWDYCRRFLLFIKANRLKLTTTSVQLAPIGLHGKDRENRWRVLCSPSNHLGVLPCRQRSVEP